MKKKFEIGQRVEMVADCCHAKVGMRGTIIGYDSPVYDYQVKFDKKFPGGHSCNGKCENGYGHHVDEHHIKFIDTVYTTKYKPGDEVTVLPNLNGSIHYHMADGKNEMLPTEQMLTKRGKKVKIKSVTKTGKYMIEGSIFPWVDEMFVDEAEVKPINAEFKIGDVVEVVQTNIEECCKGMYSGTIGTVLTEKSPTSGYYKVRLFDGHEIWCEVKKPTRLTVKCVGYKVGERLFTKGRYYVWKNGTLDADDGLSYTALVKGTDPSKWELSEYYGFELVTNPKGIKMTEESKKHDWKITITPDGEKTIATYYEGDKAVKTVDVTRYHEDAYDPEVAAMFVTQKLFAEGRSIITVQFDSGSRKYDYLSKGLAIKRGDRVIVPTGEDNHHVAVTVVAIQPYAEDKLHVPLSKMKYVIRVAEDEKPKFKVGDIVIAKKDAPYGITTNGWKGEVVRVTVDGWITVKNATTRGDGYMVRSAYFDLAKDQTKYYNGKVVCVNNGGLRHWTVGKIYEIKDGIIFDDEGDSRRRINTLDDLPSVTLDDIKFIPVVE